MRQAVSAADGSLMSPKERPGMATGTVKESAETTAAIRCNSRFCGASRRRPGTVRLGVFNNSQAGRGGDLLVRSGGRASASMISTNRLFRVEQLRAGTHRTMPLRLAELAVVAGDVGTIRSPLQRISACFEEYPGK